MAVGELEVFFPLRLAHPDPTGREEGSAADQGF